MALRQGARALSSDWLQGYYRNFGRYQSGPITSEPRARIDTDTAPAIARISNEPRYVVPFNARLSLPSR
jgi:hypothetical protein